MAWGIEVALRVSLSVASNLHILRTVPFDSMGTVEFSMFGCGHGQCSAASREPRRPKVRCGCDRGIVRLLYLNLEL
jgi:hypothetical protein